MDRRVPKYLGANYVRGAFRSDTVRQANAIALYFGFLGLFIFGVFGLGHISAASARLQDPASLITLIDNMFLVSGLAGFLTAAVAITAEGSQHRSLDVLHRLRVRVGSATPVLFAYMLTLPLLIVGYLSIAAAMYAHSGIENAGVVTVRVGLGVAGAGLIGTGAAVTLFAALAARADRQIARAAAAVAAVVVVPSVVVVSRFPGLLDTVPLSLGGVRLLYQSNVPMLMLLFVAAIMVIAGYRSFHNAVSEARVPQVREAKPAWSLLRAPGSPLPKLIGKDIALIARGQLNAMAPLVAAFVVTGVPLFNVLSSGSGSHLPEMAGGSFTLAVGLGPMISAHALARVFEFETGRLSLLRLPGAQGKAALGKLVVMGTASLVVCSPLFVAGLLVGGMPLILLSLALVALASLVSATVALRHGDPLGVGGRLGVAGQIHAALVAIGVCILGVVASTLLSTQGTWSIVFVSIVLSIALLVSAARFVAAVRVWKRQDV